MTNVYVSPTGSGNKSGSDWANAGIITNLDTLIKKAGAGGTVFLQADAGAYQVGGAIQVKNGGTAGAAVTIKGVNRDGTEANVVIEGTRPTTWDPANPSGNELFRLSNAASNLVFENMTINNVKYAFHAASDLSNLTIKDMTVANVERFFEDYVGGNATSATVSGLTIRNVDVSGFSRGVVRLQYDTNNVVIDDVHGDSQHEDGGNFAIGVHLDGSVHDVLIKNSSMINATDTTSGYWNGDGFATEWDVYRVRFENTLSAGNTDAGYDLKSSETTLVNAVADDNKKNFRIWDEATLINVTGKNPHLRGGSGDQIQVEVSKNAHVTIIGGTFSDASNSTIVFNGSGSVGMAGATIVHGAGGQLFSDAIAATITGSDTIKIAHVQGVLGTSVGYDATGVATQSMSSSTLMKAIAGNEVFYGTQGTDAILFDTRSGINFGADTVRGFANGDSVVTTTKLADPNNDGIIQADSSARFFLGSSNGGNDSGWFKVFAPTTKGVTKLKLVDTVVEHGVSHYVYANATGESSPAAVKALLDSTFGAAHDLTDSIQVPPVTIPEVTIPEVTTPVVTTPEVPVAVIPTPVVTAPVAEAPVVTAPVNPPAAIESPTPTGGDSAPAATTPPPPPPVTTASHVPTNAMVSTAANDKLVGTSAHDVFFFDTAKGTNLGNDTISYFAAGDRIVTTSKIYDPDGDGKVKFNSSDRLYLTGPGGTADDSVGWIKAKYGASGMVSSLKLTDTVVDHGETYYVYTAANDSSAGASLIFT